jgi:hypothetical protein
VVKAKILALALLALALAAGGASGASKPTKPGVPRFSPESLLAADVPSSTVQAVAGRGFWPELPAFNSIVDQEDPQPLTAVSQSYDALGGSGKIITRLYAFANREIALQYLQSQALVVGTIDQKSPAIGDQHFYFPTTLADGTPSTRFHFIHGQIGVEIQVNGVAWSRARIAQLATPLDERIGQLLAGKLRAPVMPAQQLALLPGGQAAPGPVLGTASIPAEAWATAVHKGSPRSIRNQLVEDGDATIPFRRYLRQGSGSDVIEITLFSFSSPGAASRWFAPFDAGVKRHPEDALDAGATGVRSAFRLELDNYELEFVAGRYVADVFCFAPFVSHASDGCQAATRMLAEHWYAQLAR